MRREEEIYGEWRTLIGSYIKERRLGDAMQFQYGGLLHMLPRVQIYFIQEFPGLASLFIRTFFWVIFSRLFSFRNHRKKPGTMF